jgi:hypothetical protein
MYTSVKDPMNVPFRPSPPADLDDLDDLNNLNPIDEKVSSILAIVLVVFGAMMVAADLSATVLPKIYHRHEIKEVFVSPVHREVDWEKNILHKLQPKSAGEIKP